MSINRNWTFCDGSGQLRPGASLGRRAEGVTRRNLVVGMGLGALGLMASGSALAEVTVRPEPTENTLVVIFLRGGADGLSILVPYEEEAYHRLRPSTALAAPDNRRAPADSRTLRLDDRFGLHPSLRPLYAHYESGSMAGIVAIGSEDETRSHFEAMSAMERGLGTDGAGPASGWIARHLDVTPRPDATPLRAVAFGTNPPDSLRGAINATTLQSVMDYRLRTDDDQVRRLSDAMQKLAGTARDEASEASRDTLRVLDTIRNLPPASDSNVTYPETPLARGLQEAARLIRSGVGVEVACLDMGGWDTHVAQGSVVGWMPTLLQEVAGGLDAFVRDLGPRMKNVTVVVMSEFGRRVGENSGLGTDHGQGGSMLVLGGGVRGGRIYGRWPGLTEERLQGPGDLEVTTDYREVLGEILLNRLQNQRTDLVFPDYRKKPAKIGVVGLV